MTPLLRLARGPLVLLAAVTLAACGSGDASQTATNAPGATKPTPATTAMQDEAMHGSHPAGATTVVHIKDDLFDPAKVEVRAGDTVVWHWDGKNSHNVDGGTFRSKVQISGTFQRVFAKPGSYDYRCDVHPTMLASVAVT